MGSFFSFFEYMGLTIYPLNEFVQSHFSDGFLMKYFNVIIYYKIRKQFGEQYCLLVAVGLGCISAWVGIPGEFLFHFLSYNCIIRIRTTQFVLYKLYTNCIVRIPTRCGFCTNSYKQIHTFGCGFCTNSYNYYTNCIVQIHTKCDFYFYYKSMQTSRERPARAARAKPELQARSASRKRAA
jgi:hypothetical protein